MRLLIAGLILFMGLEARAGDPPPFTGALEEGQSRTFVLPPAGPRTFWCVSLDGGEGCDLDLRIGASKQRKWTSALEGAQEELLVPADAKLEALIEHYGGARSAFTLRCAKVEPTGRVVPGKELGGKTAAGAGAWQVHEVPPTTTFTRVTLAGPEGVDLDLELRDAAGVSLGASAGETADEELVLAPCAKARWLVVHGPIAAYTLASETVGEGAPTLGAAPVKGTIEPGEERFFRLRTSKPGIVTVTLTGPAKTDLDLEVWGPDGYHRESAAEDASEEIAVNGARRGDYLVRVVSPDETSKGEFTIGTEALELGRLAASGKGGPVTWGLFVGIAAYREVEALTYTAGDALSVYQCLREVGDVDARHSVVLLDEQAKRADVVAALKAIAARADEDDTFVFFYSGHGGNDAEDGAREDRKDEKDGGDEYLVCQDSTEDLSGDLVDDDLAVLLDGLKCRTQLLIIDACFAGGLTELIDRPGRWGLFSSLETQESSEALSIKRGLMTSIVQRGLRGEADEDEDGKVTTAEVAAFVTKIQPNTCPTCMATVAPDAKVCRGCGEPLEGENERQIPVIADQLAPPAVLSRPGERLRGGAR